MNSHPATKRQLIKNQILKLSQRKTWSCPILKTGGYRILLIGKNERVKIIQDFPWPFVAYIMSEGNKKGIIFEHNCRYHRLDDLDIVIWEKEA